MDLDKLENILKSSPKGTFKAVIPVDFAGYPVDGERLRALADEYGFAIVEDACHAPGGSFIDSKGIQHMVGDCAYADMTVFSYHPVKHIATGEGGSITTNRKDLLINSLYIVLMGLQKIRNYWNILMAFGIMKCKSWDITIG